MRNIFWCLLMGLAACASEGVIDTRLIDIARASNDVWIEHGFRSTKSFRRHVKTIEVCHVVGFRFEDCELVWQLERETVEVSAESALDRIGYGDAVPGYALSQLPQSLIKGESYRVHLWSEDRQRLWFGEFVF